MRPLKFLRPLALVVSGFATVLSVHAQSYPIDKIVVQGGAPYTDEEILATAQFQPGMALTAQTIADPAQHLLDTGMFDSAEMSLGGAGNRTATLVLKPTPLDKLLPASFENFVWWSATERDEEIHKRVPMYRGVCADAGNLPDMIQTALQQMVAEKGVQATLTHAIVGPTTAQPHRVVNFAITRPPVYLAALTVTGAPPPIAEATQQVSTRLVKTGFNEGLAGTTTRDALLYPARSAGYIAADLSNIQWTTSASASGIAMTYSATIVAGEPYRVSSIAWEPTAIYSAESFAKDDTLHAGDIASIKALQAIEVKILTAYRAKGYIDAYVGPSPVRDDAAHTVAYSLRVVPGDPYRIKSVTALNLSPEAKQEFDANWLLKPDTVYNETYIADFIHNNTALKHLSTYSAGYQTIGDPATHTVDVTITFVPSAMTR